MSTLTATASRSRRRSRLPQGPDRLRRALPKPRLCSRCRRVFSGAMRLAHHWAAEHASKTLNDILTMRDIHTMRDLRRSL